MWSRISVEDRFFLATAVVAATMGFFLGLAGATLDGWASWLEKWATLIAGILAVVAAVFTIMQMSRIDVRQAKRHEQILTQNLRADRLRAGRARHDHPEKMRAAAHRLTVALNEFDEFLKSEPAFLDVAIWARVENAAYEVVSVQTPPQIEEAADLFGPAMAERFLTLKGYCKGLITSHQVYRQSWPEVAIEGGTSRYAAPRVSKNLTMLTDAMRETVNIMEAFATDLDRLPSEIG